MSLTILQIVAPCQVGGLESVVENLCGGLADRGHRVHLASIEDDARAGVFAERLRAGGTQVHSIRLPARAYRLERERIGHLCETLAPDVVHTHGYRCDVIDSPVARARSIPTVTTVHGMTGGGLRNAIYEILQRRAFRRMDAVLAVSAPLAATLGAASDRRVRVLPNAWRGVEPAMDRAEARRTLGIPSAATVIGWIGRLSAEKGPGAAIRAFSRVGAPNERLSIVGDGPERARCEALAHDLGLADRIVFHGVVPKASELMPAFDLILSSSRTEGTPITLLEAMAASRPILAYGVGGVPDLLGDAAYLVTPADLDALAAGLRRLGDDPNLRAALGQRGRARLLSRHGRGDWLDRHERIYGELSKGSHPVAQHETSALR